MTRSEWLRTQYMWMLRSILMALGGGLALGGALSAFTLYRGDAWFDLSETPDRFLVVTSFMIDNLVTFLSCALGIIIGLCINSWNIPIFLIRRTWKDLLTKLTVSLIIAFLVLWTLQIVTPMAEAPAFAIGGLTLINMVIASTMGLSYGFQAYVSHAVFTRRERTYYTTKRMKGQLMRRVLVWLFLPWRDRMRLVGAFAYGILNVVLSISLGGLLSSTINSDNPWAEVLAFTGTVAASVTLTCLLGIILRLINMFSIFPSSRNWMLNRWERPLVESFMDNISPLRSNEEEQADEMEEEEEEEPDEEVDEETEETPAQPVSDYVPHGTKGGIYSDDYLDDSDVVTRSRD